MGFIGESGADACAADAFFCVVAPVDGDLLVPPAELPGRFAAAGAGAGDAPAIAVGVAGAVAGDAAVGGRFCAGPACDPEDEARGTSIVMVSAERQLSERGRLSLRVALWPCYPRNWSTVAAVLA